MPNIFLILQVVFASILIVMILMQPKGTGFARSWGSSGSSFTRRGLEKVTFRATFIVSAAFIIVSILQLVF
ncbi:preprotein translocase subunit SecG [Candidatus Woesebacteria bacterium RIFCSPLOWO2_01_FULL_39_61]|uniref:Protein-export membrane protein SecG n=1 Tax=Candidatus Woesebacteria bacterium RIFCSPHIGHO2_02_FULL_39_13 TaxID=1802505 RepID=A0A1F7Z422_9BACT|nr:MAG: preprotein translocase subunit SecG [Candidatus Woesebacteria bacterium RIFCSPHIGHO2_01_FULL_39_95]OGM33688.1 MAG: preprotein translocase subunit SecG [Candidatus Woesebacteria bacterium RIFCSPHIGHO2_02_FULL_39_13]OGM38924.1 MAG: preprotein translocase subunit SecG [Candidatus Woesebacteria bacterium RIFCSPHIGHO2_12_FULL_40_20]OGM68136.1 MAG: preprotein translocase subunit SecG [Candidatus Woesebacteria bacterium RIFCSPLOWO2_01_FULL_39_61]OGM73167.1 MAG: preprotein translocase subunit S